MSPTFSIITPSFNRCYCLWKAIQSVLNQTYPYFELLIVDDGSTDDTDLLIKEFSDPRINYLYNKKNQGASKARNLGLKKAKGKYIAYLDSDNSWYPDFLETMLKGFEEYPDKILLFAKKNYRLHIIEKNKNNSHSPDRHHHPLTIRDEFTNHKKHFDRQRLWQRRILIDTNTMVHKKDEIIDLGGWDEKIDFWEDWELTLRVSDKYPESILSLNRTLVDYEQTIDLHDYDKRVRHWEDCEKYIFEKYRNNPLLDNQDWFPPQKNNKSTLGILEFLKEKKK